MKLVEAGQLSLLHCRLGVLVLGAGVFCAMLFGKSCSPSQSVITGQSRQSEIMSTVSGKGA